MAGGIDWFRWHHGSVTDPKFQLIAKKTSVRVGDVLAVWAFVLEKASANLDRGSIGDIDFEALDLHLGIDDGTSERIFEAMKSRALILEDRVSKWEERQPKREREDTTAAERKRRQREREQEKNPPVDDGVNSNVTPCHTMSHHVTPRGEERREELTTNPNGLVVASPADDRHPCPHQEIIALYHEVLPMCPRVRDWTPARATQLRARWNEDERRQNLEWWRKYFEYVLTCDFLVGKTHKPFFADLEWLVKSSNFTKTREGKYENREAA